ncbi:hypothetical protein NLU13_1155 [Sarocladium strictum]|uniref:Uncharacterized protein n=1 Tax=Sarocladium strictum TaxID=5046 RepID=A0AA39GQN6_SARSR|nr:hypothetical protein NLU13_1155 [Sarocladium strictum]
MNGIAMSSTKSSGQQRTTSTSNHRRNIVNSSTTTTKKHPSLINISASLSNPTPRLARSPFQSHAATSRTITYTSTSIHTRSKPPSLVSEPSSRVPLQPRDRNQDARSVTTSSRTSSCVSIAVSSRSSARPNRMPPIGGSGERPRQPQLAAKPLRPPLTPKVASKASHSQPVTPLGRRAPPVQTPTVATLASAKDEAASPLASFLTHNITPRSGSRQSRVESTTTTPSGTPVPDRASDGWADSPKLAGLGASISPLENGRSTAVGSALGEPADSKFFYASEARSAQASTTSSRPSSNVNKSPPTFFYANGTTAHNSSAPSNPANPIYSSNTAATSEPTVSKFFYANGTPDVSAKGGMIPSGPGSALTSASRLPHSRPTTSNSAMPPVIPPITSRPTSPIKAASNPTTHTLHNNSSSPTPSLAAPMLAPAPRNVGFRRDSMESSTHRTSRAHSRTGSIPSIETVTGTRLTHSPTSPGPVSPLPSPGVMQPAVTMATIMQAVDAIGEEDDSKDGEAPCALQSPTKSVSNDPISELVMNARRERKVQDLEITNASLEAINRTLERQLRKQTAELRRYRRLSRSGRLSLASVASSRVTSGASTIQGGLPDLSEEEDSCAEDDSIDEDDLSSSESRSTDEPLSPDTRILARRKRDEKRLQLDLTKHQELLIDSQKINQSLKRCLDWTEVLIKEGKKALDYHVSVSEVELGGRVLAPPDEDEEESTYLEQLTDGEPSRADSAQRPSLAVRRVRETTPLDRG